MNNELFWFDNVEIRPHPWPGLNWVTPILQFPDVKKARDLYIDAFNFVSIFDQADGDEIVVTRLRYRGTNFLMAKEGLDYPGQSPATSQSAPHFNYYIYVDNLDATYKKALELGMTSVFEAAETPWGDSRARLRCPFGYIWDIAQRLR